LRERLPRTLALVGERASKLYHADAKEIEAAKQSFRDFVSLCEEKEREADEPALIIASW